MHTFKSTLLKFVFFIFSTIMPMAAIADFSHLNVDHREIVQLRLSPFTDSVCPEPSFSNRSLRVVLTTGKFANNEFAVPAGKELIITDVAWAVLKSGEWSGGLVQPWLVPRVEGTPVFLSSAGLIAILPGVNAPPSGTDIVAGHVNLTAGVRVASRRTICLAAPVVSNFGTTNFAASTRFNDVSIQGYLVDKTK